MIKENYVILKFNTQIAREQSMWAPKKPLRAPTYFCNPHSVPAPRPPAPCSAPLRRFSATPAHRSTQFWARSAHIFSARERWPSARVV